MKIELRDADSFVSELESCENPSVVRVDVVVKQDRAVSEVSLVCGFHDDRYLYEANIDCGKDFAGGTPEASNEAKGIVQRIKETANRRSVECRSGRYQWPM